MLIVLISHGVLRETASEWCVIGTESLLTTNGTQGVERIGCCTENALKRRRWCCRVQCCILFSVHFSKSGARPRADLNRDRWILYTTRSIATENFWSDCFTLGLFSTSGDLAPWAFEPKPSLDTPRGRLPQRNFWFRLLPLEVHFEVWS